MKLVRTPQGEIKEVSAVGENTELTTDVVCELLSGEAAGIGLFNERITQIEQIVSELETKKLNYDNGDAEAIQSEIDKWTSELSTIPGQKASALNRISVYTRYV